MLEWAYVIYLVKAHITPFPVSVENTNKMFIFYSKSIMLIVIPILESRVPNLSCITPMIYYVVIHLITSLNCISNE